MMTTITSNIKITTAGNANYQQCQSMVLLAHVIFIYTFLLSVRVVPIHINFTLLLQCFIIGILST